MSDTPPFEKPTMSALLGDLASDASHFARSEAAYLRAQVGERTRYAKPAIAMMGMGAALMIGVMIALPIGFILALTPWLGALGALLLVTLAGTGLGLGLLIRGTRRVKAALKAPDQR